MSVVFHNLGEVAASSGNLAEAEAFLHRPFRRCRPYRQARRPRLEIATHEGESPYFERITADDA